MSDDYAPDLRPWYIERQGATNGRQGAYFARDKAEALRHMALHTWSYGPGLYDLSYRDEATGEMRFVETYETSATHAGLKTEVRA